MNKAMWRYYALNQLLNGARFNQLPEPAQEVVNETNAAELYARALDFSKPQISDLTKSVLNFFRVSSYPMAVSAKGKVLPLDSIVEYVQKGSMKIQDVEQWSQAMLTDVIMVDTPAPSLVDGVLLVPTKQFSVNDVSDAFFEAFHLRCWGAIDADSNVQDLVRYLIDVTEPTEMLNMTSDSLMNVLGLFASTEMSPTWLAKTALMVHDLSKTYTLTKSLCWWADDADELVAMMLPKGRGDQLVPTKIPRKEIMKLCNDNPVNLAQLYVQGDRIVTRED